MVDLHDGRVFLGANWGLNTAGTSARAVSQHDTYSNNAVIFERAMGNVADAIGKTINLKLIEPEKEFKLRMITPGDRDYLFEIEKHGFLLRAIANGDKMELIVGDTAEQMKEALS